MKLTLEQIQTVTMGAAFVRETEDGILFSRFTDAQLDMYPARHVIGVTPDSCRIGVGIRLHMRTDSTYLYLRAKVGKSFVGRDYFSFDVLVNGEPAGYLDCFDKDALQGIHEKTFALGEGVKEVQLHLPHSVLTCLQEVSLEDGAFLEPVRREKKLLCYGDSITLGYDAKRPSNTYAAKLADALGAELRNKGVGGDQVFPELPAMEEAFTPDYITAAYGANDITHVTDAEFGRRYRAFLLAALEKYPNAKIFVISPIWRNDQGSDYLMGTCEGMDRAVREQCAGLSRVTYIRGWDLVPHDPAYYGDGFLHPNDAGFAHYAQGVAAAVLQAEG